MACKITVTTAAGVVSYSGIYKTTIDAAMDAAKKFWGQPVKVLVTA